MANHAPLHVAWLVDTKERITTADGKTAEVWEIKYTSDPATLSDWAKHFRGHYCSDAEIDRLRDGTGLSRAEYLVNIKFPDAIDKPGPSIRAGDFGEILAADYLEYVLGYWTPRTRYGDKTVRNESTKGCDNIGFKFVIIGQESPDDALAIFEVKAQFSGIKATARLQNAVDDSIKDQVRKAESLNAIKQRLYREQKLAEVSRVERFQNKEDKPYKEVSGAVALFCTSVFDSASIASTNTAHHPNLSSLLLLVIRAERAMALVGELYARAANEA
jgi:hypothetical protein